LLLAAYIGSGGIVIEQEPELITIIEGPTPEFHPSPQGWLQSLHEGPHDQDAVVCQLRTNNGEDIQARCLDAWEDGRPVQLEYPDEMRMRQYADVIAMRLAEMEEGQVLQLWLSFPVDYEEKEGLDGGDDGFYNG
jgi:hypothetical protein